MSISHKSFSGGFRFKDFQGQPDKKVKDIGLPPEVVIPLKQGFGYEVLPIVKPGDNVKAGQVIGIDKESLSSPVHSSVNGTVKEITKIDYYIKKINAIKIISDGTDDWQALEGSRLDWEKLSPSEIKSLLYMSGVTSLDKDGIPSDNKSSVIMPVDVEDVIIHSADSESYNLSLPVLFKGKRLFNFVDGIKILKTAMPKAKFHLVLNRFEKELIEELDKITSRLEWINVYSVIPKYPQDYNEVLVPSILGKKFPYGYSAANILVVVLNVQTVLHAFDAVALGKPVIDRTLALCGMGWNENVHIKTRIGTSVDFITDRFLKTKDEYRIVLDSLLTRNAITDTSLPVKRTDSLLISVIENTKREFFAFMRMGAHKGSYSKTYLSSLIPNASIHCDTNIHGNERPCISCGFCEEVCPVKIIPHLLYKYSINNMIDERLMNYGVFNCIECNLCNFVCPSKIKILESIKEGQEKLINTGCDNSTCILPYFDLSGLDEYKGIK